MSKEKFKEFAKKNPEFAINVKHGKTTWQELYEIYDMYGEESELFNQYRKGLKKESSLSSLGIKDIINGLKGINIETLQENLNGLQKAVGFIEDITNTIRKKGPEEKEKRNIKNPEVLERFFDD